MTDALEQLAITTHYENHGIQASAGLTVKFCRRGQWFVKLANCNGPLATYKLVAGKLELV